MLAAQRVEELGDHAVVFVAQHQLHGKEKGQVGGGERAREGMRPTRDGHVADDLTAGTVAMRSLDGQRSEAEIDRRHGGADLGLLREGIERITGGTAIGIDFALGFEIGPGDLETECADQSVRWTDGPKLEHEDALVLVLADEVDRRLGGAVGELVVKGQALVFEQPRGAVETRELKEPIDEPPNAEQGGLPFVGEVLRRRLTDRRG